MDKKFKTWLVCLCDKTINETYEDIKNNDKLLLARLSMINFCDANGYDITKSVNKIKKLTERKLIDFANFEIFNVYFKTVDDICNLFDNDMSDIETFFYTYCLYNGYDVVKVYNENIKCGNLDGVFEVIPNNDKVDALSNVTDSVKKELSSIYTKKHLTKVWNTLDEEQKFEALKAIY